MKRTVCIFLTAALILAGCSQTQPKGRENLTAETEKSAVSTGAPRYEVAPETFALTLYDGETKLPASLPGKMEKIESLQENGAETAWIYPERELSLAVRAKEDYLEVEIQSLSKEDITGSFPLVSGDYFYLPLGEGKRVPSQDERWREYLTEMEIGAMEGLSMPFFAVSLGERALVYIMEDPYRTELRFEVRDDLLLHLEHSFPEIAPEQTKRFRIYVTDNEPVKIAGLYKNYLKEQGKFVTLEEKERLSPSVKKLYGAPHIYLWAGRAISPEDVDWIAFRREAQGKVLSYLAEYVKAMETGDELFTVLSEIPGQDYVSEYQKNVVCRAITEAVGSDGFYREDIFPVLSEQAKQLSSKGKLNAQEQIMLNKMALHDNLDGVFREPKDWGYEESAGLIQTMSDSGISKAFIGLDNWVNAWFHPQMVQDARDLGYLIGPYDSYHSIHEPGREQWNTAAFQDASLYEEASIENKNGEKIKGFNQVGRKLNPTLSMPAVEQRTEEILSTGLPFNAWFVDCDAAGEVYDDYTPARRTTMEQDVAARVKRLDYIGRERHMVVGSEGGNDYAASAIAFAHGIELPSFSWRDEDMKKNQESEYYIGRYYSPTGGVPEHFGKKIPLKEKWSHIFTDISFDVPLYRLVYHNAVITTYHWDWSTLKIEGEENNRMMREILYDVPPLYHLDRETWEEQKEGILSHVKVWSEFAGKAAREEMTDFQYLSEDGRVQKTTFGEQLEVVANFSEINYVHEGEDVAPGSVFIISEGEGRHYSPGRSK